MAISKEEIENMLSLCENEGFDYLFNHHSSFKEIDDETFQELLTNMRWSRAQFKVYLEKIAKDHIDDEYYIYDCLGW